MGPKTFKNLFLEVKLDLFDYKKVQNELVCAIKCPKKGLNSKSRPKSNLIAILTFIKPNISN